VKRELAKLIGRLSKHFQPTVHVLVPRMLLMFLIAKLEAEFTNPADINRELHRLGIWGGSRCLVELSKPEDLRKIYPADHDPEGVADFMEVYSILAWNWFSGHSPYFSSKIIKEENGYIIEGIVKSVEDKETFADKIETVSGVNPYYIASGGFEAATAIAFKILRVENIWWSVWRPIDKNGIIGFYIQRTIPVEKVVEVIEKEKPGFFKDVSLKDSAKFLLEYLGVKLPSF